MVCKVLKLTIGRTQVGVFSMMDQSCKNPIYAPSLPRNINLTFKDLDELLSFHHNSAPYVGAGKCCIGDNREDERSLIGKTGGEEGKSERDEDKMDKVGTAGAGAEMLGGLA